MGFSHGRFPPQASARQRKMIGASGGPSSQFEVTVTSGAPIVWAESNALCLCSGWLAPEKSFLGTDSAAGWRPTDHRSIIPAQIVSPHLSARMKTRRFLTGCRIGSRVVGRFTECPSNGQVDRKIEHGAGRLGRCRKRRLRHQSRLKPAQIRREPSGCRKIRVPFSWCSVSIAMLPVREMGRLYA